MYYNARVKGYGSETVQDSGCVLEDAIKALQELGVCLESIWPYDLECVDKRPSDEAYEQAKGHKIDQAAPVDINLNAMKSCLAQGFPFAFGLQLFTPFDKAAKAGVVPMPDASAGNREEHEL